MKQRPTGRPSSEKIIRDIKRNTRKQYSAEEKIRIVLDGVRGEDSIAGLRNPRGERLQHAFNEFTNFIFALGALLTLIGLAVSCLALV